MSEVPFSYLHSYDLRVLVLGALGGEISGAIPVVSKQSSLDQNRKFQSRLGNFGSAKDIAPGSRVQVQDDHATLCQVSCTRYILLCFERIPTSNEQISCVSKPFARPRVF